MQPPEEVMVQKFLPALRLFVSQSLRGQGFSQTKVAAMLGMTQPSVSLYDSSDTKRAYAALAKLSVSREEADRYTALLSEDLKRNPAYAVETLGTVWTGLLGRGAICEEHRRMYPMLVQCDVCMREFGSRMGERSEAIAQVAGAVKFLESSKTFVSVMPEVSVNLACLAGGSSSLEDVVAVPGRIVRVNDSARAMRPPAAGSSKHMAGVLLLAHKRCEGFGAVINLRYDSKMARVVKDLKLRVLEIGGYSRTGAGDPTLDALTNKLVASKIEFDAVVDSGSKGIEPNLYLFDRDAMGVARLAVRVSELYSAS